MRSIFQIFIFLISAHLFSQQRTYFDIDWNETTKEQARYYRDVVPKDGKFLVSDYYISGQLQFKGVSTADTEPLTLEGEAIWYDENGNISQKGHFNNNAYEGDITTYYSNGILRSKGTYVKGVLEGIYAEYFPTGEVANEANFLNDQIHGAHVKYRAPNQLEYKIGYKNGVVDGPYEFYNGSGHLFNKGHAKNGVQEGRCYDYYYKGSLWQEYTIKDGKLDGQLTMYTTDGEIAGTGMFEDGKTVSYNSKAVGLINNSQFSNIMVLKKGVEHWKTYRDGKLVLESFYKNGYKTGTWNVYTFDGTELYKTMTYSTETDCKQPYLQTTKDTFDPFLFTSPRFGFDGELVDSNDCEGVDTTWHSDDSSKHPFYHMVRLKRPDDGDKESPKANLMDYKESANAKDFLEQNNCVPHPNHTEVMVCAKQLNSIKHTVFLSDNVALLQQLRAEAQPKDNEIYFYYQKFEERVYDMDKEETPTRYMGFKIPKVLKEAFKDKTLDYISVIGVYEQDFWNIDNFSGLSAYSAYEKEMEN